MKNTLQNAASQFTGLWGKPKATKKVAPARAVRRAPSPSDLALAKFAGDPAIVARHAAWGLGRQWPKDEVFEQRASRFFNLSADKIVGVLGCGTGGSALHIANYLPTFIHGYDWRQEVEAPAAEIISKSGQGAKVLVRSMNLDTVFPPKTRCHGLIAVEPVLTFAQPKILDWLRLAVVGGGQVIFEEPSIEPGGSAVSWFAGTKAENCFWQTPGQRESALQRAGFNVLRLQETTGSSMRALRAAITQSENFANELSDAIELAPILEPVREFFTKEVNEAKNRLRTLEVGDVAVYRYRVIKQHA